MNDKANETEVIPKCARVECQTLRAKLDVAKKSIRNAIDIVHSDYCNNPNSHIEPCFWLRMDLAKLEELEK